MNWKLMKITLTKTAISFLIALCIQRVKINELKLMKQV